MRYSPIPKDPGSAPVAPNLLDYDAARAGFSWDAEAAALLDGLPGGGLNLAFECVERHARGPRRDHTALRWLGRHGERVELTYGELHERSCRFARVLAELGVQPGDAVFLLLDRVPALHVAVLGALRHGAVVCTLFSAFGPAPVCERLQLGAARVLVTTPRLYTRKVAGIREAVGGLAHVLVTGVDAGAAAPPGTLDLDAALAATTPEHSLCATRPDDPALLHFTSGTTGTPKGAVLAHRAVLGQLVSARMALDLHPDDVFWCTADPGWVTGTAYGIVAPLAAGVTSVVDEAPFDAERWYSILERERVSVWYTAPTAVRMMMRAGAEAARAHVLPDLRFVASVGEPLNPEAVLWGVEAFGLPIHDNWWQTETGGIMIANYAACEIRPGSMGRPLPGVDAAILARDDQGELVLDGDGAPVAIDEPLVEGELALRRGWPSMFTTYLGQPERYAKCFVGDWYRTGDLAMRDADGWYWFVGRADDVIKSAGHLIGPFEVESALMEHPAVAEAGVIGKPDPVAGEVVKAFVVLRPGHDPRGDTNDALVTELMGFARTRLGAAIAPREIELRTELPKTRSGKIMRRLLRARELGLPEGDLSALEGAEQ